MKFVRGPTAAIWCRWSITVIELKPASSAARTVAESCSKSRSAPTPGNVKLDRCRPSVIGARIAGTLLARLGEPDGGEPARAPHTVRPELRLADDHGRVGEV